MVFENMNSILCKESCEKILYAVDPSKKLVKYKINKFSEKVVGFMAEHYLLTITFSNKNEENSTQCRTFFLKAMPRQNEKQRDYVKSMGAFDKEILLYKNLISEFLKISSKPFAPKYYFSKPDQCIVIEDVSAQNYQVCTMRYLDYEKTKGALEALARFHAASIVFEERRSNNGIPYRIDAHFPEEVAEGSFSFKTGHKRNMWCISATSCLENLSKFFTTDSKVAQKIKTYVFSDKGLKKFLRSSDKYRNVVCHDDLWRNNMMFNENNDCVLIDLQMARYSPPVFDVLLFLYYNLERHFMESNLSSFLEIYYSFFRSELLLHNINVDEVMSKAELLSAVEEYTVPALVETCLYATHTFIPDEISNLIVSDNKIFEEFSFKNRSPFVVKEYETNERFKERFNNILEPLYETFENM